MGARKSKKKFSQAQTGAIVELNVMPFVDIFSLLCTFLLFSTVVVSIGILQVQVPFLSNADSGQNAKEENRRKILLKVNIDKSHVRIITSYNQPPKELKERKFPRTISGLKNFHDEMIEIKDKNKKTDKVTLFVDDSVVYDDLVMILDRIKLRYPEGPLQEGGKISGDGKEMALFPKVVMGNILL